jgi:hypothetical protein
MGDEISGSDARAQGGEVTDRYKGKPFLELVDAYVLDSIGHLHPDADAELAAREPEFHELFGIDGSWREIVERRMNFPDGMAGAILEVWRKGRNSFVIKHREEPVPRDFARHFVDSHFPH